MKIGETVYKAQQATEAAAGKGDDHDAGGSAGGSAPKQDENVVDAEFEEVDDKKKKSA
jgi:molecular chaperone DnaK